MCRANPSRWSGCAAAGGHFYTPDASLEYQEKVGNYCYTAMQKAGLSGEPTGAPVRLICWITGWLSGDTDNILKNIKDGLTGVFYLDDKQVVEEHAFLRRVDMSKERYMGVWIEIATEGLAAWCTQPVNPELFPDSG